MAAILNDLGVGNGISRQKFMLDSELGNEHCDIVCVAIGFVMFEMRQVVSDAINRSFNLPSFPGR